jgi:hypothetical protein
MRRAVAQAASLRIGKIPNGLGNAADSAGASVRYAASRVRALGLSGVRRGGIAMDMSTTALARGRGVGALVAWLRGWKALVVALTGLLIGIPALVNAAIDVYRAVRDIPASPLERTNSELFRKHFGRSPVSTTLATITGAQGARFEIQVDIFAGGDLLVRYGSRMQWFPLDAPDAIAGWLIPAAHAQSPASSFEKVPADARFSQAQTFERGQLVQTRIYLAPDGRSAYRETLRINPNTGEIVERRLDPATPESFRDSLAPGRAYNSLPRVERVR